MAKRSKGYFKKRTLKLEDLSNEISDARLEFHKVEMQYINNKVLNDEFAKLTTEALKQMSLILGNLNEVTIKLVEDNEKRVVNRIKRKIKSIFSK